MLITPEQLDKVTDTLLISKCQAFADLLNRLCPAYGITDKGVFRMFLANCLQESSELTKRSENMSYSAQRMVALFPDRFPTLAVAKQYEHKPKEFANKLYGGRYGNIAGTDDGYNLRGGGFFGITFRGTWTDYATYKKMTIEQATDYVRNSDEGSMDSACWFFAIYKKLIPVALTGNFKAVCSLINTGSTKKTAIGMDVRQKYFDRLVALD